MGYIVIKIHNLDKVEKPLQELRDDFQKQREELLHLHIVRHDQRNELNELRGEMRALQAELQQLSREYLPRKHLQGPRDELQ